MCLYISSVFQVIGMICFNLSFTSKLENLIMRDSNVQRLDWQINYKMLHKHQIYIHKHIHTQTILTHNYKYLRMLRVNINYLDEIGRVREFQASVTTLNMFLLVFVLTLLFSSTIFFDKMFLFKSVEKKKNYFDNVLIEN